MTRRLPTSSIVAGLTCLLTAALAGCAAVEPSPIAHANDAAAAACRAQADRAFEAQNRYLLSERSSNDSPLSANGMVGITSQGLGQRYGRDRDFAACMHGGAGSPLPGPQAVTIQ